MKLIEIKKCRECPFLLKKYVFKHGSGSLKKKLLFFTQTFAKERIMKLIEIKKCRECPFLLKKYVFKHGSGSLKKKPFCNYEALHGKPTRARLLVENEKVLDVNCPIKDDWDEIIYEIEKMDNYVLYKRLKKDERP
jgi:hypothetical protein